MDVLAIVLLLVALGLVLRFVVWEALQELRHVRRRLAIRKELDAARSAAPHSDPSRRVVRGLGARVRPADRPGSAVSPLLAVPARDAGLAGATGHAAYPGNLYAFRSELARRGATLDDLRIEQ